MMELTGLRHINKYFLIKSLEAKPVLTTPKCGNTEVGNLIPHQRSTLFFRVGHKYLDLHELSILCPRYIVRLHPSYTYSQPRADIDPGIQRKENGVSH